MTTFSETLIETGEVLGGLLEKALGQDGRLLGDVAFNPQTADFLYNFETTKALSPSSWSFFRQLAELREYKQYKHDGSWYTDENGLKRNWSNPKGAKWSIVVTPNQLVDVWQLLQKHGVDTVAVFEPMFWDAETVKQNTRLLVDRAFGNRRNQMEFNDEGHGDYSITITAQSKGTEEDNKEFRRILEPTLEPPVGRIDEVESTDTENKDDQPTLEYEVLFEKLSSNDTLSALYRVAEAARQPPISISSTTTADSKRSSKAQPKPKHVPVDQGASLMIVRVKTALESLYPGETVRLSPISSRRMQVIFTGKPDRGYASNVENIIRKIDPKGFSWIYYDKDRRTIMEIDIGRADQWIETLSKLAEKRQTSGSGSGSRGPLSTSVVPRTALGTSIANSFRRLSLGDADSDPDAGVYDFLAKPITTTTTTTTNFNSPPGRAKTGGHARRQLSFAGANTDTPTPLVTTTSRFADATETALLQQGLSIVQATEIKQVVEGKIAEQVAKNTASFVLQGPKAISELPAGQGLGAAVISQASIEQFYKATQQFNIPSTKKPLNEMQERLASIKSRASQIGLTPAIGDWVRFTPQMASMRDRLASQSQAVSSFGQMAGRLTVSVSHPPRQDVPPGIDTASAMWGYARDHSANQVAETLHAYDSKYVAGDSYDPFVATVACMVVIRGLMTKRDVTRENRVILNLAMGIPAEFNWVNLDETTLLANPGILFLSTIPDLSLPESAPEEARAFAKAFTDIIQACRAVVINDIAIDKLLHDDDEPDRLQLNVTRALQLQWVAALFRALNDPNSHASKGFTTRVAFMWRAKADHLTQSIFAQATKAGHVKPWIAELKRLQEPDLSRPAQIIDAVQNWPSNSTETQLKLLMASVLVDSHYLNFSESKRQAWRQMLQDSGVDIPVVRAFFYMNQFV